MSYLEPVRRISDMAEEEKSYLELKNEARALLKKIEEKRQNINREDQLETVKEIISDFKFSAEELGFKPAVAGASKTRAVSILWDKASGLIYTGGPSQPDVFKQMSKEEKEACKVSLEQLKALIAERQKKDKSYKPVFSVAFQSKFDAS